MIVMLAGNDSKTAEGHEDEDQYETIFIKRLIKAFLIVQCHLSHHLISDPTKW